LLRLNIFFTIFFLLSFCLNAIEYDIYKSDRKLESIGKEYNTNPYQNQQWNKNSLIISGGIANGTIQPLIRYSGNQEYTNNGLNDIKITSNYSIAYLRKVSDRLSVGVEVGMYNPATSTLNNEPFITKQSFTKAVNIKNIENSQRSFTGSTSNLCNKLTDTQTNGLLVILCKNNSSVSMCDMINAVFSGYCSTFNGYMSESLICADSRFSQYCGANQQINFSSKDALCRDLLTYVGGNNFFTYGSVGLTDCVFTPIMTDIPPLTEETVCQLFPHLCTPPSLEDVCNLYPSLCSQNPPTEEEVCGLFPELCTPPSMEEVCRLYPEICASGGGNENNRQATSITSNSYTAYFLINYEIIKISKVSIAIECGLGGNYRDMKLRGAVVGSGQNVAFTGKAGLIGSYYISNNFALGLGANYVYMGEQQFKNLGKTDRFQGYDFKMQSSNTITYNLQLRYLF
jgi:hypothetical protein